MHPQSKRLLIAAFCALLALPSDAGASDHEVPRVVLHAPRGQKLVGALGKHNWYRQSPTDPSRCEGDYAPDAPFVSARPPLEVRRGARLTVRLHKEDEPASMEVKGPSGPLPFTLRPYAPDGQVVAWDAKFKAPASGRRYAIGVTGSWPHEDCTFPDAGAPPPTQYAEWGFSVRKRRS